VRHGDVLFFHDSTFSLFPRIDISEEDICAYESALEVDGLPMIPIDDGPSIPEEEIVFTHSRSGGPGGQNVNKVNTRVILWFDVRNSPSLNDEQRNIISRRLANRINKDGILYISSQGSRSQAANRRDAVERFRDLIGQALKKTPSRKKTRVSRTARERRVLAKRHRGEIKRVRSTPVTSGDWD
jgi:ribosome-associated protein